MYLRGGGDGEWEARTVAVAGSCETVLTRSESHVGRA